jgi:large subunit ribosomal protein L9
MRVVFLQDVAGVAQGGDVKEVKNGFARNYLIPKNFAVPATHNELQRVKQYAEQAERTRLRLLRDMRELSETLNGKRIDVEMRAGASGQLYGSVTNAIIADKLSELSGREIDRRGIEIGDPIRQLGSFDVSVRLHPEVQAQIEVLVYPTGTTADAWLQSLEEADEIEEGAEAIVDEVESDESINEPAESEEDNPDNAS